MKTSYIFKFLCALMISINGIYAQKNLNSIDKSSLIEILSQEKIQLLDVRTEHEFQDGAIEGAINIDFWDPDFEQKVMAKMNKKITIVVYCAAGGRSEMACKLLSKNGFKLIYDLQGGYEDYAN